MVKATPVSKFCLDFHGNVYLFVKDGDITASYLCRRELHDNHQESDNVFARKRWDRVFFTMGVMGTALPGCGVDLGKKTKTYLGFFFLFAAGNAASYRTHQPAFVLVLPRPERAHSEMLQLSTAVSPYLTSWSSLRPIYCSFQRVDGFGRLVLTRA